MTQGERKKSPKLTTMSKNTGGMELIVPHVGILLKLITSQTMITQMDNPICAGFSQYL